MGIKVLFGVAFCAVLAFATFDPAPLTWGPVGHSSAAAIAQTLLNAYANRTTTTILNGSLSDFASWADNVRPYFPWSGGLHFIDTPDWACTYVYNRDCIDSKGILGRCVDGAIQNYTARTGNYSIGQNQQTQALKFLIHFIGDVHQPLHVSFTSDRGGNDINCTFPGKTKTNLHSLWDSGMIKKRIADDFGGDNFRWVSYLVSRMNNPDDLKPFVADWKWCPAQSLKNACSKTWAGESAALACQYAYSDTDNKPFKAGTAVSNAYYQRAIPIIETQVVKAGVRLANVLNTIFPPK